MTFRSVLLGALFCCACGSTEPQEAPTPEAEPPVETKAPEAPEAQALPSLAEGAKGHSSSVLKTERVSRHPCRLSLDSRVRRYDRRVKTTRTVAITILSLTVKASNKAL